MGTSKGISKDISTSVKQRHQAWALSTGIKHEHQAQALAQALALEFNEYKLYITKH